jgi:hypothetical protein
MALLAGQSRILNKLALALPNLEVQAGKSRFYIRHTSTGFVSGHGFSRAVNDAVDEAFRP